MRALLPVLAVAVAVALFFLLRDESEPHAAGRGGAAESTDAPEQGKGSITLVGGTVVDDATGKPIEGAYVFRGDTLLVAGPDTELTPRTFHAMPRLDIEGPEVVRTQENGSFEIEPPESGMLEVAIWAPGYVLLRESIGAQDKPAQYRLTAAPQGELKVVDEAGKSVAGARVYFYPFAYYQQAPRKRMVTGADGIVRFERADDLLLVRAEGYADERCEDDAKLVTLRPGYRLAGKVVDSTGGFVAGAEIELTSHSDNVHAAQTAADGSFAIDALDAREWHLSCSAPGFSPGWLTTWPGDEQLRIVLYRSCGYSGSVVYPDGSPATGAHISDGGVVCLGDTYFTLPGSEVDEQGGFSEEVGPGPVTLRAHAEGYTSETLRFKLKEGERRDGLVLRLRKKAKSYVRVQVLDDEGAPPQGMAVAWRERVHLPPGAVLDERGFAAMPRKSERENVVLVQPGRTDGEGRCRLWVPLPEGSRVIVRAYENLQWSIPRSLLATQVETITTGREGGVTIVRLPRPVFVSFVLRGKDNDDLEGWVNLGDMVLLDPERTYRLVATAAGHHTLKDERWKPPAAGGEVVLKLKQKPGGLPLIVLGSGRIIDSSGKPVGGVALTGFDDPSEAVAVTRGDGRFEFGAGDNEVLRIFKTGYGIRFVRATPELDIVLEPEGRLRIRVDFPLPWRVADWRFDLGFELDEQGRLYWERRRVVKLGDDHRFEVVHWFTRHVSYGLLPASAECEVRNLPPGTLHVKLWSSGYAVTKKVTIRSGRTAEVTFR